MDMTLRMLIQIRWMMKDMEHIAPESLAQKAIMASASVV